MSIDNWQWPSYSSCLLHFLRWRVDISILRRRFFTPGLQSRVCNKYFQAWIVHEIQIYQQSTCLILEIRKHCQDFWKIWPRSRAGYSKKKWTSIGKVIFNSRYKKVSGFISCWHSHWPTCNHIQWNLAIWRHQPSGSIWKIKGWNILVVWWMIMSNCSWCLFYLFKHLLFSFAFVFVFVLCICICWLVRLSKCGRAFAAVCLSSVLFCRGRNLFVPRAGYIHQQKGWTWL